MSHFCFLILLSVVVSFWFHLFECIQGIRHQRDVRVVRRVVEDRAPVFFVVNLIPCGDSDTGIFGQNYFFVVVVVLVVFGFTWFQI